MNSVTLILGNQLFSNYYKTGPCLMIEDKGIASSYRYHKTRILHQFISMREFRDELIRSDVQVSYFEYEKSKSMSFFQRIKSVLSSNDTRTLCTAMIPDANFRESLTNWAKNEEIQITFLPSPQFLVNHEEFKKIPVERLKSLS